MNKFYKNRRISISLRLTAIHAVILSIILLIISILTINIVERVLMKEYKSEIKKVTEDVKKYIKSGKEINKDILQEVTLKDGIHLKIFGEDESLIFQNKLDTIEINIKEYNELDLIDLADDSRMEILYLNKVVFKENKKYYVQVAKKLDAYDAFLETLYVILVIMNIFGVIIAVISGIYLSRKILKPIEWITNTAKSISIHDLDERINVHGADDELKELGETFNDMIDRLQESFEREKQFVSDASHELRTPISVIQGYIDILDRWGKDDKEVLEESILEIKNETFNMKKLIEQLLFLARGDNKKYKLNYSEFYLNELIDDIVNETKMIDNKHTIINNVNGKVIINADFDAIKQVLRIIIDNSIKYTADHGDIFIESEKQNDYVEIRVKDTGIGIPKEEQPYIFDRFYRVDKSRSKDTGGSGVGLAIAKWIVKKHLGAIKVESELGKGTQIIIKLPINMY
ncbi:ATP-binding protein [Clostridium aestuarii]|uniref:histidine kinase n=1 Tax=Clostridium aestuarii TaxID=338193 RepID=A0ABT4D054_9CLOT|nr:ATP-binding protein [Clostridium aestuarii]MCY6484614.1 ATP-binding protein [Clostridium aestuarii]